MRRTICQCLLICACVSTLFSQSSQSDDELLTKTRSLYDAPFTRNLISFDCAVQFDWKKHFAEALGALPPAATPTVERLQTVSHRVFVDHSGAVVSAIPKAPDLSAVPHGSDLEQALTGMVTGGVNGWIPFALNEILPIKPTNFHFEKSPDGYTVKMTGTGVDAALTLAPDFRLVNGISHQPQSLRFATKFIDGPQGFLLQNVETEPISATDAGGKANFAYAFQAVEGYQLPSEVTVTPITGEVWRIGLSDCKVMQGVTVNVAAPPKM